jgi:hypothetical protein
MSGDDANGWARPITLGIIGAAAMFAIAARQQRTAHVAAPAAKAPAVAHGAPAAHAAPAAKLELHVPRTSAPLKIDGELDEADWTRAPGRTGSFLGQDGAPARPFSDARLLHDDENLYLALFAADEDVRVAKVAADGPVWMGDAFSLVLTTSDGSTRAIDIGASGTITDGTSMPGKPVDYAWRSEARVASDVDGTPDKPDDRDEEWILEVAIPLRVLGLSGRAGERVGIVIKRCDQGREETRRSCGSFGSTSSPALLLLE